MIWGSIEMAALQTDPGHRMQRSRRALRQCKKYGEIQVLFGDADALSRVGAPSGKGSSEHRNSFEFPHSTSFTPGRPVK